jgi:hypothetical protein
MLKLELGPRGVFLLCGMLLSRFIFIWEHGVIIRVHPIILLGAPHKLRGSLRWGLIQRPKHRGLTPTGVSPQVERRKGKGG